MRLDSDHILRFEKQNYLFPFCVILEFWLQKYFNYTPTERTVPTEKQKCDTK